MTKIIYKYYKIYNEFIISDVNFELYEIKICKF